MVMSLALLSSSKWKKRSSKAMRRGRRRRRRDDFVAPEIHLDLLIEILTRLPAESLMRFKCVSKLWYSLICSRYFSNRYFTVASPRRLLRLFMSLVDHFDCGSKEVCHKPCDTILLAFSSSSSNISASKSFDQDDLIVPGIGGSHMVTCRGLILHTVCRQACIYNPTTRQSVTLPPVKSNIFAQKSFRKSVFYSFGHDPVLDQYKIVCTVVMSSKHLKRMTSEHWVFVLEVGGSWKRIEWDQPHYPTGTGVCIRGVIYYLANTGMSREILVCFDIRCEQFNMIHVAHFVSESAEHAGLIEYCGKPAIFDYTYLVQEGLVNLWVLEDAGKLSKKSLVLQNCHMRLLENNISLFLRGTTQNGEVVLTPSPYYILFYDIKKNDLRKVQVRGIPKNTLWNCFYLWKLMDDTESIMHLET